MRRSIIGTALVFLACLSAAGCAEDDEKARISAYVIGPSPDGRHDVVLCEDGAGESDPPTCAGTPVVGWGWDAVAHETGQNDSATRFGHYSLEFERLDDGRVKVDMASVTAEPPEE